MIKANIHEVKARLSEYLAKLGDDDVLLVCKRNTPVAEIRKIRGHPLKKRPIGMSAGRFEVPASFFDPLPDDVLDAFEGRAR